jgi:hypothetical protein
LEINPSLRRGLYTHHGDIIHPALKDTKVGWR